MARTTAARTYGKASTKAKARRLFAEVPPSPPRKSDAAISVASDDDSVIKITEKLHGFEIQDEVYSSEDELSRDFNSIVVALPPQPAKSGSPKRELKKTPRATRSVATPKVKRTLSTPASKVEALETEIAEPVSPPHPGYRVLTWEEVCPPGDTIEKIAEASYAEVYRVRNERGTSIIKCIRLESPIKAQTKAQERSGLVDEEPHSEDDMRGELRISEWLADIPGFVIYKERYLVKGKAPKCLLETHQSFHRKMKRKDPDRLQFYPSPSRYLADTTFLVVELGDAGTALEDFELENSSQLWDIFFHVAIALARAEEMACFEHRDLHEGNLCIRKTKEPMTRDPKKAAPYFGYSGLDITILDYGLSRAEDLEVEESDPIALDLEKDLSIFTSTHAPQCKVYRQMRSLLLRGERGHLPPSAHKVPYAKGVGGEPLSWDVYVPYTNVLWLAYLYQYMVKGFKGEKKDVAEFKKVTKEMWKYLDPDAKAGTPAFGSSAEVVRFAFEAGWLDESHLMDIGGEEREDSIILSREETEELARRRSPRKLR
ncbi:Gsg2 protein kinase [Colletotrichum higginsianum IMI 349063]|uniref:non-specific serine/threonine protein kinase n=2 Tax=Colletotrichum higginsianum TaxID=80884 RepID=A0A1B7YQF9_COLHI|nr:Gsg2 protein kinase [Colletotrichum higginsianum IMI 349063]OBR14192.1 Gsg2 protein kinase [Colletotrichum higginsianum IMI 349063]TID02307.1 Serine/threonine-protein kinase haspin-like protein [Colletotrichum higginsianum]